MNHLHLIVSSRWKNIAASIASMKLLRLISFIFVISCFLFGAYYLFLRVFGYLTTVEVIGYALMDRIIEMAFFVFFIMLVFSNVITSFSTFFNNRELDFLFALPVQPTSIYLAKLFESCTYASWATMVIALPLVVAYGVVTQAPIFYYPIAVSSIFIYVIIPAALASMLIFAIFRFLPRLTSRDVIILSLVLISGLTFLYVRVNNPALLKIFETENEQELLQYAANLTAVGGTYIPSTWLSNILKGCNGDIHQGVFYFFLLLFVTFSTVIIAFFVAKILYAQSWLLVGERGTQRKKRISILSRRQTSATKALLAKDILLFVREPTQWVQLFVFIILLAVYVFSLRRTPMYFTFPLWRTIIAFANFAYISFVIATLGVRFIFPTVSLERAGIWLLGSSPFSFERLIKIKYFFSLFTAVIIIECLLLLSNLLIKTDQRLHVTMPFIALVVAASLVSINLGMGSRFPQFKEDNPSKIAAGSGGILAALMSITYVGIMVIILATPAYYYLRGRFLNKPHNVFMIVVACVLFIIINIATIVLPLRIGILSFKRRDF